MVHEPAWTIDVTTDVVRGDRPGRLVVHDPAVDEHEALVMVERWVLELVAGSPGARVGSTDLDSEDGSVYAVVSGWSDGTVRVCHGPASLGQPMWQVARVVYRAALR